MTPKLILRFSEEEITQLSFDGPEVAETFRVNAEKRTISGLAVPWGKVARSGFARWRFKPNSLRWSDAKRVKLNLHHDPAQAIGYALGIRNTSEGLDVTFKIAEVPEGDRALALAKGGVLDGLSIEVDFEDGDGWQPDPADESIRLVTQAKLRGVALTSMPAYDDARVAAVAAQRNQGGIVPPEAEETPQESTQAPDAGALFEANISSLADKIAESHQKLTENLAESLGESFSAGIKTALEDLAAPQGGPEPVKAARYAVVREAPVYTLDGRGPSLVRDAWYASREHDDEAKERLRRFQNQTAEVAKVAADRLSFMVAERAMFAEVNTTTAAEVIPPGYRPDLFVPQLEQGRPIVNALSRGTIANATPFVVPVFKAASGMTGDHTEGEPPTEGTLELDTKTVTPGAISGKLPLTREIVDSANPAIDQIALAAMREDYARQTEAKAYAALNGSSGQGGAVTNGFVSSGAQVYEPAADIVDGEDTSAGALLLKAVRQQLALYPFRRYAAPTRALMSQRATTAFATAEDKNGRPLLPSVGAQNAAGMGNAVQVGWFVDGLAHVPAWAISETDPGDADIFTLNSADVWAWESPVLSFRFEEKQGPEIIELALFGYFAVHILRPVGLSAIRMKAAATS